MNGTKSFRKYTLYLNILPQFVFVTDQLPPRGDDGRGVMSWRKGIFCVCHGQFELKSATARVNCCFSPLSKFLSCIVQSFSREASISISEADNQGWTQSSETEPELQATQCSARERRTNTCSKQVFQASHLTHVAAVVCVSCVFFQKL